MEMRTLIVLFIGFAIAALIVIEFTLGSISHQEHLICQHLAVQGC